MTREFWAVSEAVGDSLRSEIMMFGWCFALHGNHDEHQCHKKPGHLNSGKQYSAKHECYCGVWW